jgi:hypothetical protein
MVKEKIKISAFETFFASKEDSNCPIIPNVIKTGREIEKKDKELDIILSVRYGGRMLSNVVVNNFDEIGRKEFIETVDYDPVKKVLLTIGSKEGMKETPIHWMIQHARSDIHVIIQINSLNNLEKYRVPSVENKQDILEIVKDILRKLRDDKIVKIENQGLIFTGKSLESVKKDVLKIL